MKRYIQGRKNLIVGLLAVLLCSSLMPITASVPLQKEELMRTQGCLNGIILNGTMGNANWYISPVTITFDNENGSWVQCFLRIDDGDWFEYTGPIIVDTEGLHEVWWYYIDQYGNQSSIFSVSFKIDMTAPTVNITVERIGFFKYGVSVQFLDNISGFGSLEFYLDDALIGEITVWPFHLVIHIGFGKHVVKVIGYDGAGLNGSDSVNISVFKKNVQPFTFFDAPLLPPIHRTYFLGKIHNLTIDGNDYHFESYNIRKFWFWRYNIRSWGFSYDHFVGQYSCSWGGAEFHGILKPSFICGYFTFLS